MPGAGAEAGSPLRLLLHAVLFAAARAPLDLELRRRLFEYVGRYPGLHLREVARALDIHPSHAKYHLQKLEKRGLVSSRHEDGYWRFWPREEGSVGLRDRLSRQEKTVLAILRRPVPLYIALVLLDRARATHSEILDEVKVAHATLHYHLSKMEKGGVLESEKVGRQRFYRLQEPDRVLHLLLTYRPPAPIIRRFLDAWENLEADPVTIRQAAHFLGGAVAGRKQGTGRVKVFVQPAAGGAPTTKRAASDAPPSLARSQDDEGMQRTDPGKGAAKDARSSTDAEAQEEGSVAQEPPTSRQEAVDRDGGEGEEAEAQDHDPPGRDGSSGSKPKEPVRRAGSSHPTAAKEG